MLLNHHPHTTSHLIVKTDNNKNNLKATIQSHQLQSSRMTGTITATKSSSTPKPSTTATASTQAQQKSVVMMNNSSNSNSNNKYGDKSIDPVGGAGKMVNGPTISFGSSATNTPCLTKPPIQKAATVVASATAATANASAVAKTDNNKNVNIKNSQISSIKDDGDSKSDQSTNPTSNNLKRKLPLLNDINEMITCALCSGYFIDATTIIECLDTFCKSCIVNYLETSKSCPICDVPLSKIKPHQSLRHDKLKQSLVYKLAPQVFIDEMKRRREFYQKSPPEAITSIENETGPDATVSLEPFSKEDGGLVPIHSYYFRPNDKISMSLEYLDGPVIPNQQQQPGINSKMNVGPSSATTTVNKKPTRSSRTLANDNSKTKNRANDANDENFIYIPPEDKPKRRYLLCPAALTILQLKKLLSNKFGEFETFSEFKIEIYYAGQLLKDDFTLMEVAYIYTWGANDPMRFSYCFVRKRPKTQLKAIENSIEEPSSSQQSLGRSLRPSSSSTSTSNYQNSTSNTTTTTTTTRSTSLTRGGSGGSACQNNDGSRNTNSSSSFLNRSTSSSSSSSPSASSAHHLAPGTSSSSGNSQKRIAITNPIQKVSVSNNSRIIIQREYDNYHPGESAKKRPKLMDDDAEFTHTGTQTLTPSTNSSSSTSNGNSSRNSVPSVPTTTTTVRITTTTTSSAGYSVRSSSASAVSTKTSSALSSSAITVSRKRNGDFVAQPSLEHKNVHHQQHSIKRSASNSINGAKEMNQPIALKTTTVSESTNKPTIIKLVQRPVTMVKDSAAATTAGSNKKEASSNHHHHHHHSSHHHHHHHSKDYNIGGQNQQQQKLSTSAYSVQNLINIDNNSNQNKKTTVVKGNQAINNTKSSSSPINSSSINTSHSNGKDSGGSIKPSHPLSPPAIRIKLTTSPNSSPSQLIGQIISPIPPEVQNELKSNSAKSSESPKHKSSGSNSNSSINAPQGYKMVTSQGVQSSSTSANSSSSATTSAAAEATTATTSSTTSTSTSSTTTSAANSKSGGRGKGIHDIINKMASQKSNFKSSCLKPFGSSTTGNGNVQPQADGQQQPQQQQQQQQQQQPQPQSQPHSPTSSSFEELINAKKSLDIEKTTSLTITTSKLIDSSTSAKEQSPQQQQQQSTATKSSGNLVLRISRKPQTANPTSNSIDDSETFKSDCSNASGAGETKQTKEKQIASPRLSCSSQLNLGDDDDDDDDDENSIEPKLVVDMDHDDDDDEDEDAIDSDDDDDETRTMLLIDDQCENDSGRGSSTSSEINAKISETSTPLGSKSGLMVQRSIASTASSKSGITSLDNSPLSVSAILTSTSPTISPRNSITLDVDTCKTVSAVKSSLISAPTIRPRGTFVAPLDLSSKKLSPSPPRSNSNKSGQSPSSRASSPGAVSPACSPTKLVVPTAKQQCSESTSTSTSSSVGKSSQPLPSLGGIPWHMFPKRPKSLASKIVPPLPPSMMLPKMSPVVSPPITVSLSNIFNNNSISGTSSSIVGNKSSQRSNKISNISVGSGINPIPQLISTSQATSSGTSCTPFVPGNFPFSPYDPLNLVRGMAEFMYNQHHPAIKLSSNSRALSSNHRYNLLNRTNSSSLSLSSIPSNLLNVVNSASAGNTNNNNNLNTTSSSNNLKRFMEREPQNRSIKCAIYSKNNTSRGGQSGGSSSHNKNGNLFGSSSSSSSVMVSNNNNSTKSPTLINNRQQPKSSPSSSTAAAGSIPSSSSTSLQQQRNLSSSSSSKASSSSSSTTSTQYQPVFPH